MGAKPSGVTLSDPSGICVANANGKPAVYKNGSTIWPADGMVDAGTYTNVKATYDCGRDDYYSVEPKSCPTLEVTPVQANMISCDGGWQTTNCTALSKDLELGECVGVEVVNIPAASVHYAPTHNFRLVCAEKDKANDPTISFTMTYNTTDYTSSGNYHANDITQSVGTSAPNASDGYKYPDLTGKKACFKASTNVSKVTCKLDVQSQ